MEISGINPNDIVRPQGGVEKIASLFQRSGVTNDLIQRLSKLDTTVTLPDAKGVKIDLDDVKKEIKREVKRNKDFYTEGFRYNSMIEAGRKRSKLMEAALQKQDWRALIKPMLDEASEAWRLADARDAWANSLTSQERADFEVTHKHNVEEEDEIYRRERETGQGQEHGIPPELTEVTGERNRVVSRAYLARAAVLAKKVLSESR